MEYKTSARFVLRDNLCEKYGISAASRRCQWVLQDIAISAAPKKWRRRRRSILCRHAEIEVRSKQTTFATSEQRTLHMLNRRRLDSKAGRWWETSSPAHLSCPFSAAIPASWLAAAVDCALQLSSRLLNLTFSREAVSRQTGRSAVTRALIFERCDIRAPADKKSCRCGEKKDISRRITTSVFLTRSQKQGGRFTAGGGWRRMAARSCDRTAHTCGGRGGLVAASYGRLLTGSRISGDPGDEACRPIGLRASTRGMRRWLAVRGRRLFSAFTGVACDGARAINAFSCPRIGASRVSTF